MAPFPCISNRDAARLGFIVRQDASRSCLSWPICREAGAEAPQACVVSGWDTEEEALRCLAERLVNLDGTSDLPATMTPEQRCLWQCFRPSVAQQLDLWAQCLGYVGYAAERPSTSAWEAERSDF